MTKPKHKDGDVCKRDALPRKAKEQSVLNLEKLAVIMEVIEVSSAVEDVKTLKKKLRSKKEKKTNLNPTKNELELLNPTASEFQECEDKSDSLSIQSDKKKLKMPVLLPNTTGLSLFMELEERKDLLYNSPMADPLGPDSFDNFQWVEVKQELPDDVEVGNVTLTELPLKVDEKEASIDQVLPQEPPAAPAEENILSERDQSDNDSWDQDSSFDDSNVEQLDNENSEENVREKKSKNHPQKCDLCGKTLSSRGSLRVHKLKKHKQKVQFNCDLCGMKFDYQREVVQHRNSTHRQGDGRFCCEMCTKRYLDYHSFLLHIKSHLKRCEEGCNSVCKECSKTFQNNESLKIHYILVHRMEGIELGDSLKSQEKNFICHTCGKRFTFNCQLRDHLNLHTGSKPYMCQKCGKSFSQKATLKQHVKTHGEVRPFQCSECPLGFYGRGDLKKHIRKHTGERPYVCEVCGEGFSRKSHLMVHLRSHTGERPYSCDVCERAFSKQSDLVRHQRIHTGALPYLCQVCGKAFRHSTRCANHIKSQHPDTQVPVFVAKNPNPLCQRIQSQLLC